MKRFSLVFLVSFFLFINSNAHAASTYLVGAGMYDITGPFVGLTTMGYGAPTPVANGIHQRLRARAFVIADPTSLQRVAYVNTDLCFVTQAIRLAVTSTLAKKYPKFYSRDNIMLAATHTHSAFGGLSHHKFFNIPSDGFSEATFNVVVKGIIESIERAQANLVPGEIYMAQSELVGASKNRSLPAYLENPAAERAQYDTNTDSSVTNLRVVAASGKEIGSINWYAVHGTSLNKQNTFISGDNKGLAAYMFEKNKGNDYKTTDGFVAIFSNSNSGDASPNVDGDVDGDGDWECKENENFRCNEKSAQMQYLKSVELYNSADEKLTGPLGYKNQYLDFKNIKVDTRFSGTRNPVTTCPGGFGLSMLAGSAEDGPGVGSEGKNCSGGGVLVRILCARKVSKCHGEKPVVLSFGTKTPAWTPQTLPIQIIRLGQLAIIAVPGEFTTMSGRRLRQTVMNVLQPYGVKHIVLAGYANAFSAYTATPEEYQIQHYEGASTQFGRWQLPAYQQSFHYLATALVKGTEVKNAKIEQPSVADDAKMERNYDSPETAFGTILEQPKASYKRGQTMQMKYVGSNPNHNTMVQSSFFAIQYLQGGDWVDVVHDWDANTIFGYQADNGSRPTDSVTWKILGDTKPGTYRVSFQGMARLAATSYRNYKGYSDEFQVE